jgi:hypothetical protein
MVGIINIIKRIMWDIGYKIGQEIILSDINSIRTKYEIIRIEEFGGCK